MKTQKKKKKLKDFFFELLEEHNLKEGQSYSGYIIYYKPGLKH